MKPIAITAVQSDPDEIAVDGDNPGVLITKDHIGVYAGSGAPTFAANKGSLYLRTDGSSTSTRAYINTDGSTSWAAVTTAS
jgi:hypothetical protein